VVDTVFGEQSCVGIEVGALEGVKRRFLLGGGVGREYGVCDGLLVGS